MGAADIVPGVSGGTVALILGVYQRLLEAISSFDAEFLGFVRRGKLAEAAGHIDLRFLVLLAGGILSGVVGLAGLMSHLLTHHREATYAAFFGLILASGIIVGRMARPEGSGEKALGFALGIIAAIFAFWLMTLGRFDPIGGLPYTFVCGAIAICAMILPGVSGAYLLLMLGKYEDITDILHRLPKLDVTSADIATVAVFCVGCLTGLLLFSRLLKWLLARHWSPTMSVLCGFMIGSLYRVWPWQIDTTPEVEKFKKKVFEPIMPEAFESGVITCLVIAAVAFAVVLTAEAMAAKHGAPAQKSPDAE